MMAKKGPREPDREYVASSQIKVAKTDGIDDKAVYLRYLERGLHRSDGHWAEMLTS